MQPAPPSTDWLALRAAALALIAEGVLGRVAVFLKAVREAKATALGLIFALARALEPAPIKPPKPRKTAARSAPSAAPRDANRDDRWRNPPVVAFIVDPPTVTPLKAVKRADPQRSDRRVTQALVALQRILDLCAHPERYAARLRRRLDRADVVLTPAESRAFGITARAKARRNREARRAIERDWRGRRRRRRLDSG